MSPLAVSIRDARPNDVATIVEFNRRLALETEGKALDLATLERGVARALAAPPACRYFLAESGGRVVGQVMITYEWSDWRDGVFWWLQSVYVEQPARGQGVLRALVDHVKRLAIDTADVRGLRLYVEQHNHVAQETYRRLGLRPGGYLVYEDDWSGAIRDA